MTRWPTLLSLILVVSLTGCSTGPVGELFAQEQPVAVAVTNSGNTTHLFDVYVVELPAHVTVHWSDGASETRELGQGLSNHDAGDYHTITAVNFSDSALHHGRHTLGPGETNHSSIRPSEWNRSTNGKFPPRFAVVVVVSQDEGDIFSWVSANCNDVALVGLEVTSRPNPPGGVSAAYGCR